MTTDSYNKFHHSDWNHSQISSSSTDPLVPTQSNLALSISPNNYGVSSPRYSTQFRPSYISDYPPMPIRPVQAPLQDTGATAEKSTMASCMEHITVTRVVGLLLGLVLAGVPLAVMTTLYAQSLSASGGSTTNGGGAIAATTATVSLGLPAQCSSTLYTPLNDATRLSTYQFCCNNDCGIGPGWYRVTGASGTRLATTPTSTGFCGSNYPIWYNGSLPTALGATASGMGCANYNGNLCHPSYSTSPVMATNCATYYVFYLPSLPFCFSTRYCTTF